MFKKEILELCQPTTNPFPDNRQQYSKSNNIINHYYRL
jgi:hypothetical protein